SPEIYERAVALGHFGERARRLSDPALRRIADTGFGLKYRMHPLAALAGLAGVELARRHQGGRRAHAAAIVERLGAVRSVSFRYDPEAAYFTFRLRYHPARPDGLPIDGFVGLARRRGLDLRQASLRPLFDLPLFQGGVEAWDRRAGSVWPRHRREE